MTTVVNKNKDTFYDSYIGRGSLFGNEWVIGKDGTRDEVIDRYKESFDKKVESDPSFRTEVLKLKNKTLGCYCKPARCHGDIIQGWLDERKALAIIGSRGFIDYDRLSGIFQRYFLCKHSIIVSGGANGADALGKQLAYAYNLDYVEFPADWDRFGKSAGFRRNKDIITCADDVLCFWDGISKGTANSLGLAKKMKKNSFVFYF